MQTALLQYPIDKVFIRLQKILKKNGFVIVSANETQITAQKRRFLRQKLSLDINALKLDEQATRIDFTINSDPGIVRKKMCFAKGEEELWNSIYNNF